MTAPLIAVSSAPKPPKQDAYAKVRSKCVDAFAQLEYSMINLCMRFELKLARRALVGQRLKRAREPETLNLVCESERQGFQQLLDRVEALLRERTDIVHSEMILASTGAESMALFRNAADRAEGKPEARVYSLSMLRKLAQDVGKLALDLDKFAPARRLAADKARVA